MHMRVGLVSVISPTVFNILFANPNERLQRRDFTFGCYSYSFDVVSSLHTEVGNGRVGGFTCIYKCMQVNSMCILQQK